MAKKERRKIILHFNVHTTRRTKGIREEGKRFIEKKSLKFYENNMCVPDSGVVFDDERSKDEY